MRSSPPSAEAGTSAPNAASVPCTESGFEETPSRLGPPPSAPLPAIESAGIESAPASAGAARREVLEHPTNTSDAETTEAAHSFRVWRVLAQDPGRREAIRITQNSVLQVRPPRRSVTSAGGPSALPEADYRGTDWEPCQGSLLERPASHRGLPPDRSPATLRCAGISA